jgi:hypothetical protein
MSKETELSVLINQLRNKTKELEEIAYQYESRNQIMIDNLTRIKETLDDKDNNLKVERQLKHQMIDTLDKNINEELVSTLPDQLMNLCEDVELIDIQCAEALGEKVKSVKYREKEQIEKERKSKKITKNDETPVKNIYTVNTDGNHYNNSNKYSYSNSNSNFNSNHNEYSNVLENADISKSSLAEFGKALGTKISSAFNEKKKIKPLSAEEIVKTVLNAVNEETSNNNDCNEFVNLSDKDVYINGENPDKFFDKINNSKVEALKKILLIHNNPIYLQELEKLPIETQLNQLTELHQKLKLKYIMYLQHIRPGMRLGKETNFLKERDVSKSFQELHDENKVITFEDYVRNFQKDLLEPESNEESNQDMLDRLFGDLDDIDTDLHVQIIRSMLLSSMLRSPDIEENFYKKRIHDLESLVKYIEKYEQQVPNQKLHLEPAVIRPETSMSKVLEADVPDFVLCKDIEDNNVLQEMIKYYFHSDNKERINSFLAEMQEIERSTSIEPEVDHQFKILDDSYFQTHVSHST